MQRLLNILTLFFVIPVCVYAQVNDNFSDGDFTNGTVWTGEDSKFLVNGAEELQIDDPVATDTAYLSTANSDIDDTEWNFYLRLGFNNPSNNNFVRIYLVSDQADLTQTQNGYYLHIGETGSDDAIEMYKISGGAHAFVARGVDGHGAVTSGSLELRIKVLRDNLGNWTVSSDTTGGNVFQTEFTVFEDEHTSTNHFGVYGRHTTSNADAFYFDDIYIGPEIVDSDPPMVYACQALDEFTILVPFSEALDLTSSENPFNYTISNGIGTPNSAVRQPNLTDVVLTTGVPMTNGTIYQIEIDNIEDLAGNVATNLFNAFAYYHPTIYDVQFNEIMADPDSTITEMPNEEYIELKNNTGFILHLDNWQIFDASAINSGSPAVIPDGGILPGGYMVLTKSTVVHKFNPSWNVVGLSNWPSLNNSGDDLLLLDENGATMDYVKYHDTWYKDPSRDDGGYSLEKIDVNVPCLGEENWAAHSGTWGGTPGWDNTVWSGLTDERFPDLQQVILQPDSSSLILIFSETIDSSEAAEVSNYTVNQGVGSPQHVEVLPYDFKRVFISFGQPFTPNIIYTIEVGSDVTDCVGNPISTFNTAQFGVPQAIATNDIVINEILFNPVSGGVDYIELYNRSSKVLELSDLFIREESTEDSSTLEIASLTPSAYQMLPQQYAVITEDADVLQLYHYAENAGLIVENPDFPNFPDDEGILAITAPSVGVIDRLHYLDDWHFELIDDEDGVSLERIDFEAATQNEFNWHSASTTSGYGTPTYLNSQSNLTLADENAITVDPPVFTPNNDGINDFVTITYELAQSDFVGALTIYDREGRVVRQLSEQQLLSAQGHFIWDGIDDNSEKARVGIYVLLLEVFDLNGQQKKFKEKVVLSRP